MTKKMIIALTVLSLAVLGCSKNDEVMAFSNSVDSLSADLVKAVNDNSDKKAGLDAAQKILDEKTPELKATYADLQNVRGFQVDEETMTKMTTSISGSITNVMSLKIALMAESMKDKELSTKLDKLLDDYQALFI